MKFDLKQQLDKIKKFWQKGRTHRLIISVADGQAKGLLAELSPGGKWVPRRVRAVALPAEATSLPTEWIQSLLAGVSGRVPIWLILPRHAISLQVLEVPSTDVGEIAEMLRLQISKFTPYAPNEVASSHWVVEETPEGYARILLLIAKREVISQATNLLVASGLLETAYVMTSCEGIVRWVQHAPAFTQVLAQHERIAVVDLDSTLTDFLILSRNRWEFSRAIPIGLNRFTEDPQKWADKLSEEVRFSFALYQGEAVGKGKEPTQLYILGPQESVAPLLERLQNVGVPVQTLDPLSDNAGLLEGESAKNVSSVTALLGAGSTPQPPRCDFLPEELALRRIVQERGLEIAKLGIGAVSVLMLLSLVMIEKVIVHHQQLARINKKIEILAPAANEVERAQMRIRVARQRMARDASVLRLLDRVYRAVPAEVTLTEVHLESDKELAIKGYSANIPRIFEFVTALEKNPLLGTVKTKSVAQRKFGNKDTADFQLSCALKTPRGHP